MKRFLLPYKFKYWGAFMFPLGFIGWYAGQMSNVYPWLSFLNFGFPYIQIFLIICFFSCLFGLLFLIFSKEKIEDEYIQKLRLESFQLAALLQILYLVYSFIRAAFLKDEDKEYWVFMFLRVLLVFWLAYIIRFNFVLLRNKFKVKNEK
jgi:ABC-type spermidine/putrescine transport system permease subunit I